MRFVLTPGEITDGRSQRRVFFLREGREGARRSAPHQHVPLRRRSARCASATFGPRSTTRTDCRCLERNGEWLFRPLRNPPRTTVARFVSTRRAASAWCNATAASRATRTSNRLPRRARAPGSSPLGDWGHGTVRLLEIATNSRATTTSHASGCPTRSPGRCSDRPSLSLALRAETLPESDLGKPSSRVCRSRTRPRSLHRGFRAAALAEQRAVEPVIAIVGARRSSSWSSTRRRIRSSRGYRASFEVLPRTPADVELRAFLQRGQRRAHRNLELPVATELVDVARPRAKAAPSRFARAAERATRASRALRRVMEYLRALGLATMTRVASLAAEIAARRQRQDPSSRATARWPKPSSASSTGCARVRRASDQIDPLWLRAFLSRPPGALLGRRRGAPSLRSQSFRRSRSPASARARALSRSRAQALACCRAGSWGCQPRRRSRQRATSCSGHALAADGLLPPSSSGPRCLRFLFALAAVGLWTAMLGSCALGYAERTPAPARDRALAPHRAGDAHLSREPRARVCRAARHARVARDVQAARRSRFSC